MLFNGSDTPQVFATPLGADFPRALVETLADSYKDQPPEALAQLRLVLNTRRMARRVTELFAERGAMLLPRISLISELDSLLPHHGAPAAEPALQTQLELSALIRKLIEAEHSKDSALAPIGSVFDLATSLAQLMGEMLEEGVGAEALHALDVSDQSGHWQRTQSFLRIVQGYEDTRGALTVQGRARLILEAIENRWSAAPPEHPILIAGSTGSRGLTSRLMQLVSRLPRGAVLLPGFDFDFASGAWPRLPKGAMSEDHPQYRFHRFLKELGLGPEAVQRWQSGTAPSDARNRLVSLALRPAPVTDQWIAEGAEAALITDKATEGVTLIEAQSKREEALAIALRLRQAAEDGTEAALITPDRTLSRQVTAALGRWGIRPDDSAGEPLHLTPVGRLLRHTVQLLHDGPLNAEDLITLLKHPLCNTSAERGTHLRYTREFELYVRRKGLPSPSEAALTAWSTAHKDDAARDWAAWVCAVFFTDGIVGENPLSAYLETHIALTETIARGQSEAETSLWASDDGSKARAILDELCACADAAGDISVFDYDNLLGTALSSAEARAGIGTHPGILIWGTLEARVQGVGLLILAGLNEGSWPEAPKPDPWLNRAMRAKTGLLLPERRIGLSAHDFQQAIAAPEVWLTRAQKADDAETIPSRWLSRLTNLMGGLPEARGEKALRRMQQRGSEWLSRARAIDAPLSEPSPEPRPAPCPPVNARPSALSLTEIQRLIRDPYAIYAKHVLGLRALNPLQKLPDALLRGTVLHEVMEEFVKACAADPSLRTAQTLRTMAGDILAREVPWPAARLMWLARFDNVIDLMIDEENIRSEKGEFLSAETDGTLTFPDLGFTLKGKADRFDQLNDGTLAIYDYKSGKPPSAGVRKAFDKQLPLTALMAAEGAFKNVPIAPIGKLAHIGLGSDAGEKPLKPDEYDIAEVHEEFRKLIIAFADQSKGYPSRRAVQELGYSGDYDHLARYGEWTDTDAPRKVPLT